MASKSRFSDNQAVSAGITRRRFLGSAAAVTASAAALPYLPKTAYAGPGKQAFKSRKVVILGFDGMDPLLSGKLMSEGKMPNFAKLAAGGGFSALGTSMPPQSPVAWANFINGAGPGTHGIFDFIHRNPEKQCMPFFSAAETLAGCGYWKMGEYKIQMPFWPFNHEAPETVLRRQGTPFWHWLDRAGINSTFYNLPSNYPASESKYGHHRCLSGMGTPDLLGTYGTYQHFAEDGPLKTVDEGGGMRSWIFFEGDTTDPKPVLLGPPNTMLVQPEPSKSEFTIHRDIPADSAVIKIQDKTVVLKKGQWSGWVRVDFEMTTPRLMPNQHVSGICRFYLQEVSPNFRLYVSPINTDPADPAIQLTEPAGFVKKLNRDLGLFYNTGFQEDHKALSNGVFTDSEYIRQAGIVLDERMELLERAKKDYDDGLLFFYFSSTDMQSHMLWWDTEAKHPTRSAGEAKDCFEHLKNVYCRMDAVMGDIIKHYGDEALVMALSDHGFANFRRQFNLNTWLRENGYLYPGDCKSIMTGADWSNTRAYGLGINGLYLNLKGRERDGVVETGAERELLLEELTEKLNNLRDHDGEKPIAAVRRSDEMYSGPATRLAPDLIIGYKRGYRASWETCLGDLTDEYLLDNDLPWAADHCADLTEVPGVLFANRPIARRGPSISDLAPTVLEYFGLEKPGQMTGTNVI